MQDLIIKAETQEVANTLKLFITTYKEQVNDFTNRVLTSQGTPVDAGVVVEGDDLVIYQMNPNKGFVLGEITQTLPMDAPVAVMDYSTLADGKRYVTIEGDRIFLFIKEPQGTPDPKIGAFKTLNDAVKEFNSESVKTAIKNFSDKKAAEAKEAKRTEKRLDRIAGTKTPAVATDAELVTSSSTDEDINTVVTSPNSAYGF